MNYNQTTIIECNFTDRINRKSKSNDFSVKVPPLTLPKGTQIEMSGAIVQEVSANNDSVIELSNQNYSEEAPYSSSWTAIDIRYYLTNNGTNSVAYPFIQCNWNKITAYTPPTGPQLWGDKTRYPNTTSYSHPAFNQSIPIVSYSGPGAPGFPLDGTTRVDYNWGAGTSAVWTPASTVKFYRFDDTILNAGSDYNGGWVNIDPPFDPLNTIGQGASYNAGGLSGPCGIRTALKRNQPDGSKYTYIKPGYKGCAQYDFSERTGVPDIEIYKNTIEIDLSNDLLESPDELTLLINQQLQGSLLDEKNNLKTVTAKNRFWSTNYQNKNTLDTAPRGDSLYPLGSDTIVPNISSKTLLNVPANFQNDEEHQIFGDGFFVKDAERWVSGSNFLKSCRRQTMTNAGWQVVKGLPLDEFNTTLDPLTWSHLTRGGVIQPAVQTPSIYGISLTYNQYIYQNMAADNFPISPQVEFRFIDTLRPTDLPYTLGNTFVFLLKDLSGARFKNVPGKEEWVFALRYLWNLAGAQYLYFLGKHSSRQGNLVLEIHEATLELTGFEPVLTSDPVFEIDMSCQNCLHNDKLSIYDLKNKKTYVIQVNTIGNPAQHLPFTLILKSDDISVTSPINGLPYYQITGTTIPDGGRMCGEDQVNPGDWIVDEFLTIPDKFIIPSNIQVKSQVYGDLFNVLDRVRDFYRANETYIGTETNPQLQVADKLNWICDMDIGMADDFNNAYSQWLSCNGDGENDYTIYGEQQNFSIYPPYYPNVQSTQQYDINAPANSSNQPDSYNFRRPLTIYPISRYAKMGRNYPSQENYFRVYSRYSTEIMDNITNINDKMNVDFVVGDLGKSPMSLHPLIYVDNDIIKKYCQDNDVPLVGIQYFGSQSVTVGFINYMNTAGRNLENKVSYDINTYNSGENFRTCFRVCFGCMGFGFDPSGTTNNWINSMNRDQSVITNPDFQCAEFYGNQDYDTATYGKEKPAYTNSNIISPRVEDYINFIYIGATAPKLLFQNSRLAFSDIYTPRMFNSWDSLGTGDPNEGRTIAFFNDGTLQFSCLNTTIGLVPALDIDGAGTGPDPANGNLTPLDSPGFYQPIRNIGISDTLSGIGLSDFYVRDEFSTGVKEGDNGVYKSIINLDGTTENWEHSIFQIFGFGLRQFKPLFGKSWKRYSQHDYGKTDSLKYGGINYFTLNALVNQSNSQTINVFGPNYNSSVLTPAPIPPQYDWPPPVRGQPETQLSYCGFQPINVAVSSDELRGINLPQKLQQSFYKVMTSLPTSRYITSNNSLQSCGYFYRNLKNANFYFVYSQGSTFTLTDSINLTTIRTRIVNERNLPAEHLGSSCTCFYRITIPSQLSQLDAADLKTYIKASETNEGLQFSNPLTPQQSIQLNSINMKGAIVNNVNGQVMSLEGQGDFDEGEINMDEIDVNPFVMVPGPLGAKGVDFGAGMEAPLTPTPTPTAEFAESKEEEVFALKAFDRKPQIRRSRGARKASQIKRSTRVGGGVREPTPTPTPTPQATYADPTPTAEPEREATGTSTSSSSST